MGNFVISVAQRKDVNLEKKEDQGYSFTDDKDLKPEIIFGGYTQEIRKTYIINKFSKRILKKNKMQKTAQ